MKLPTHSTSHPSSTRTNRFRIFGLALMLVLLPAIALAQDDAASDDQAVVVEVADQSVTRAEFDERFDIAVRAAALQQGVPLTEESLGQFADQRAPFLEELATQLALLHEAEERGVAASEDEVDQAVTSFREQFESEDEFSTRLEELGFANTDELRASVHESLTIQALVNEISTGFEPDDEEVETFFEENREQFETPDGEIALDDVRDDIRQFLVQEQVNEEIQGIRAEADVETYPENL